MEDLDQDLDQTADQEETFKRVFHLLDDPGQANLGHEHQVRTGRAQSQEKETHPSKDQILKIRTMYPSKICRNR